MAIKIEQTAERSIEKKKKKNKYLKINIDEIEEKRKYIRIKRISMRHRAAR